MGEGLRAERLLDELAPIQRLITRLKAVIDESMAPEGWNSPKGTQAKINSFKGCLQAHIDQLTAQRKETLSLIERVSDPEAHIVLFWRYAVMDDKVMPWMDVSEKVHYEPATLYKYHRRGIEEIEAICRKEGIQHGSCCK